MWVLISIYNLIRFSRSTLNFNPMCSCFSTGICLLLLLWQSWQLLGFIECNFQRNLSRNSNNAPMCRSMIYLQTHTPLFQLAIIIYRSWVSMHFRSARSLQRVRLQKCERVHECASSVAHNQVLGWVGGWSTESACASAARRGWVTPGLQARARVCTAPIRLQAERESLPCRELFRLQISGCHRALRARTRALALCPTFDAAAARLSFN